MKSKMSLTSECVETKLCMPCTSFTSHGVVKDMKSIKKMQHTKTLQFKPQPRLELVEAALLHRWRAFARKADMLTIDCLVGLVVKAFASRAEDYEFESRLRQFFKGHVIPVTYKLALQWLPCQAPGIVGSVLGLAGLVSVYCDWVR